MQRFQFIIVKWWPASKTLLRGYNHRMRGRFTSISNDNWKRILVQRNPKAITHLGLKYLTIGFQMNDVSSLLLLSKLCIVCYLHEYFFHFLFIVILWKPCNFCLHFSKIQTDSHRLNIIILLLKHVDFLNGHYPINRDIVLIEKLRNGHHTIKTNILTEHLLYCKILRLLY